MEEKRYIKRKEKAFHDGNREQMAVSCNLLGDFYNQQGKYQCAVKEYQQEAELYEQLGKSLEMAKAHRMIGEMFMLLCEFDKAKEHINIYLTTAKKLQNKVEEQRAYVTLGRVHLLFGQSVSETSSATSTLEQFRQAEKAFLKSLLLVKELSGQISKLEQLDMQARCYLNIGVVKEHMEYFEEAVTYIEKAIQISQTNDIFELTHLCYISMSLLYHIKMNDSTAALRYTNLALQVAKRLPNKVKKICETLITKSEILTKEGDFASAKHILTKAYKKNTPDENDRKIIEKNLRIVIKICQTLDELVTTGADDHEKRKSLYEKLGDGCCHLQNYEKALEFYHKMLESAQLNAEPEKSFIPIYVSLYQTYKDNKQYEQALEYLWKEYELNKSVPAEAISTLCGIADICELQKQPFWTIHDIYEKARKHALKAEGPLQAKLEKIVLVRLRKLQINHKMFVLAEQLEVEAKQKGIDLSTIEDESDDESDEIEHNTPELGDDVCLDNLTDSEASDLDESEKPRAVRVTRGTRSLTIKRNNKGETQLHQACISGNLELARRLIEQGHVVNVRDHAGWLPLHEACNHGFRDIVALLLDKGATSAINDKGGTSCDGITPLYDACANGFLEVVELLLERGADATVKTDFGETCVGALDKWRSEAELTDGEQAHYEFLRAKLLKPISTIGMNNQDCGDPLTNANSRRLRRESLNNGLISEDETDVDSAAGDMPLTSSTRRSRHNKSAEEQSILQNRNKPSPRERNATTQYKQIMQQLKHPHRTSSLDALDTYLPSSHSSSNSITTQKRSAFLSSDEIDDSSWLIDDLGPEKKKRRHHTPTKEPTSTSKENLTDSANSTWHIESFAPEMDAFQLLLDGGNQSTATQQRRKQTHKLTLSRTSSMSSTSSYTPAQRSKTKQQTSLIDSGFCRIRSDSPLMSEDSNETSVTGLSRLTEPDSTTTSIHLLISPAKSSPLKVQTATPLVSTTVSFKIKVEDELLLVPVERRKLNDINIRWLAEEASRRYYNLVGLKPVLRLKTADGFAFEENDSVNVAIEQTMIQATVLEWNMSPLEQRYKEMCHQLNKEFDADVATVLEHAQVSNVISLTDRWLMPQHTEPIFRALLHQQSLRVLDLSNNFLQNDGCRQLAKALPTLSQLKSLHLSGNFINSEGLELLLCCAGIEKLLALEELNLSQNPLGDASIRILDRFCCSAAGKSLQKLKLSNCDFTNLYDFDLCYYQLITFDISFNPLQDDCFRKLLTQLNSSCLQQLNLSYSRAAHADDRSSLACAERIVEFFENGTCEKFKSIKLSGCALSDGNMFKLLNCLENAKELELLDISDNNRLSGDSLMLIFDKLPQLRKLVAINCTQLVDDERMLSILAVKQLPNLMSLTLTDDVQKRENYKQQLSNVWTNHWGDKAKITTEDNCLLLYVNEKDLCN